MSKTVSPKELAAVSALAGPMRYAHLVGQVADWQAVWGLRSADGWVSAAGDLGNTAFPVWPHEAYANQCIGTQWNGSVPAAIEVHEFLESFIPNMVAGSTQIAAFPTPSGSVVVVAAEQFAADIQAQLSRIE